MKGSNATSGAAANAVTTATPSGDQRSGSSPTPTAEAPPGGYPLAGPSNLPDPAICAYRQDLADVALAGQVIASHYAVPLPKHLGRPASLLSSPDGEPLAELESGTEIRILDNSRGWAWGYAEGKVGYVPADALSA